MKRVVAILIVATLSTIVGAVPSGADRPIDISESFTFVDVNPCSGLDHEITINVDVSLHLHPNGNAVATIQRSGSTDSGYEMIAGAETFVDNGNRLKDTFVDQWRRADGSKFAVHGVVVVDPDSGETIVDRFSLRCIGAA